METQQVINEISAIGISLTPEQAAQFVAYSDLLLTWNQRFNLTALEAEAEVLSLHFCDSLTALGVISANHGIRLLDVGTGAGFPGLPIKIARPDIDVTLIDGTAKKIGFCTEVVSQLNLKAVQTLHGRSEELAHDPAHREQYDVVIARAVAALPTLVEYLMPFVAVGGLCIAMKGGTAAAEAHDAAGAIRQLGGGQARVTPVALPGRDDRRALVVISKTARTASKFPRPAGAPRTAPLK